MVAKFGRVRGTVTNDCFQSQRNEPTVLETAKAVGWSVEDKAEAQAGRSDSRCRWTKPVSRAKGRFLSAEQSPIAARIGHRPKWIRTS